MRGIDVTTIIAVIVVGTETCRCRETIEDFIGEVDLSAIDILLTFHVGIVLVGSHDGRKATCSIRQALGQRSDGIA